MCVGELKSNYNFKLKRIKKNGWTLRIGAQDYSILILYCSLTFNLRFKFWKFLLLNKFCMLVRVDCKTYIYIYVSMYEISFIIENLNKKCVC